MMEIIPNVYSISSPAVNCYLISGTEGLTLIDTGLPNFRKKIARVVQSIGHQVTDIRRILITHADADHVGSLADLKNASGAMVFASAGEAAAIATGMSSRPLKVKGLQKVLFNLVSRFFQPKPVQVDEIIHPGDELPILSGLRVVGTRGHTPDHLSFLLPEQGVLFAGDSMRASSEGLIPSRGMNTWNEAIALQSVSRQAELTPEIVCCGHGPVIREAASKFPIV